MAHHTQEAVGEHLSVRAAAERLGTTSYAVLRDLDRGELTGEWMETAGGSRRRIVHAASVEALLERRAADARDAA